MIKRFFAVLTVFCLLFSINVCAENTISLKPQGEFFIYGEQTDKVSEILGMSSSDLQKYCRENFILYLAVNTDNSKQIRITKNYTDFSNSVINLSNLSDKKINDLIPSIVGITDARGEIIDLKGQKTIRVQLRSNDSGGDFLLTEYYTVANKENYIISFYTNASSDTDYIEKTLETLECSEFMNKKDAIGNWHYIFLGAAIIFAFATIFVVYTVIRDVHLERNPEDSDNEINSTDIDNSEVNSNLDLNEKN